MTTIAVCQCCGGMTFLGEQVCYVCVMRPRNVTQPIDQQAGNRPFDEQSVGNMDFGEEQEAEANRIMELWLMEFGGRA